jgi:hypothetical protein
MSLRKYLALVFSGIVMGSGIAFLISNQEKPNTSMQRSIASEKLSKMSKKHHGKVGAPIFVQISRLPESDPERGYYKLLGYISFNQAVHNLSFQWALPPEARLISGDIAGDISFSKGEDMHEEVIEIQLTNTKIEQQILFDVNVNPEYGKAPMGSSDLMVFRAMGF